MIQHSDLSKPVYDAVKAMIKSGVLAPGEKLKQEKLAGQLGVSRTPLMKALQNLENEMLVESRPRRGLYVKAITSQEIIDVYDCREGVECVAARLIIERATDEELLDLKQIFDPFIGKEVIDVSKYTLADEKFHDMLIELTKNATLKKMSELSNIHKRVYQYGLVRLPEETLAEHIRITEALIRRDVRAAESEVRNHIQLSREVLIKNYS